jgi:phage FluMu protein Com
MIDGEQLKCEFCGKSLSEAGGSMHITFGCAFCDEQCEWRYRIRNEIKAGDMVRLKSDIRNSDRPWVGRYQEEFLVAVVSPDGWFVATSDYPPEIIPIEHLEIARAATDNQEKQLLMRFSETGEDLMTDIRVDWARQWASAKYGMAWHDIRAAIRGGLYMR